LRSGLVGEISTQRTSCSRSRALSGPKSHSGGSRIISRMPPVGDEGADAVLPAGHVALDQLGRQVAAVLQAGDHQGVVDAGLVAAAGVAHQDADGRAACERRLRATALGW
jgi:hypothetical protein